MTKSLAAQTFMQLYIVILLALLLPVFAQAAEVTWTYQQPTEDCDGNPVVIVEAEAYIATSPIPAADDDCSGVVDPVPDGVKVPIPVGSDKVTVSLPSGEYYVRSRSRGESGAWSGLSNQLHIVVVETEPALNIPQPVRDTGYDWRCVNPDGTVSTHQRQDTAIFACQSRALADPAGTYYIEGGRYRVKAQ